MKPNGNGLEAQKSKGPTLLRLPRYASGKKNKNKKKKPCQGRRHKRHGLDPWVWKIPWRRAQQSTPVFVPGEPHGQRNLVGYSP